MDQIPLRLEKPIEVDIEAIRRQPSMTRALALAVDLAGFKNDKDFCRKLDTDTATWSRIKNGDGHFPHDKYELLFDVCRNETPLIWLADRRGYILTAKESELERRLRVLRERADRVEAENALLRGLIQGKAT